MFQAEYREDPSEGCVDCHADAARRPGQSRRDGVSCSGCHAPRTKPEATSLPEGVAMCARCHQFDFAALGTSGWSAYDRTDPVQETVSEWTRSRAAADGRTCASCHMPEGKHAVLGTRDPDFVRRALRVSAHRTATFLVIVLQAADVGHSMPTGDMFRRLRVRVTTEDGEVQEKRLGRRFASLPNDAETGFALRPVLDQRLRPPPDDAPTRLEFPVPAEGSVVWSVDLLRLPPETAKRRGLLPQDVEIELASGEA